MGIMEIQSFDTHEATKKKYTNSTTTEDTRKKSLRLANKTLEMCKESCPNPYLKQWHSTELNKLK